MFAQAYVVGVGEDEWEFDTACRIGHGSFGSVYLGKDRPLSTGRPGPLVPVFNSLSSCRAEPSHGGDG
jgi:hypothetical protein